MFSTGEGDRAAAEETTAGGVLQFWYKTWGLFFKESREQWRSAVNLPVFPGQSVHLLVFKNHFFFSLLLSRFYILDFFLCFVFVTVSL